MKLRFFLAAAGWCLNAPPCARAEFSVKEDRAFFDGVPVKKTEAVRITGTSDLPIRRRLAEMAGGGQTVLVGQLIRRGPGICRPPC